MSGVDFGSATDLVDGTVTRRQAPWKVAMAPFGYRFFSLAPQGTRA